MKLPLLLGFALSCGFAFGQGGSLTPPPGSPAPNMKSLDQVEARTPLVEGATGVVINPGTGGITINASGSFYLTGNLSVTGGNGVSIESDFVTLDLNGFTITSTASPAAGDGISISGKCVTVQKGNISSGYDPVEFEGPGFLNGIAGESTGPINISQVIIMSCSEHGIKLSEDPTSLTSITSCLVQGTGDTGIVANSITQCNVSNCQNGGIKGRKVLDSSVALDSGVGIEAGIVSRCESRSGFLSAIKGELVSHSQGFTGFGNGIEADCVSHSMGWGYQGNGIIATNVVSYSYGFTDLFPFDGAFGIDAKVGVACDDSGFSSITNKYLAP